MTAAEFLAGSVMASSLYVRWAAAMLFTVSASGIVLMPRNLSWFVGENGTGGSEHSVALMSAPLGIAAADREAADAG